MSKETPYEIVGRFDQNIAKYPKVIEENYGDDSNLAFSLLSFFMTKFKNNLFNSVTFTLNEFCKSYGYHKNNICSTHPLFKELKNSTNGKKHKKGEMRPYQSDDHVWSSVIDHTLYRMMKENLVFKEETTPGAKYLGSARSLQVVKSVKIRNKVTRAGREEFIYEITLGNEIFLNALRWYVSYKEQSFIELGKKRNGLGRRAVYLYLLSQYQRCLLSKVPTNEVTPNYDMLCRLAKLENKQKRNNKRDLIKILNQIGSEEHLNFSHNLASIDLDSPQFKIVIKFRKVTYFEDINHANFFIELMQLLEAQYRQVFYNNNNDAAERDEKFFENFQLWINSDSQMNEKADLIVTVYKTNFKSEITQRQALKAIQNPENWLELLYEKPIPASK